MSLPLSNQKVRTTCGCRIMGTSCAHHGRITLPIPLYGMMRKIPHRLRNMTARGALPFGLQCTPSPVGMWVT